MEETQLLKGILEGCVLSIISRGETYGYDILSVLEKHGFDEIQDGTLYPVLTRLEKKGHISCRVGISPLGPKRKYFTITDKGIGYLKQFEQTYRNITSIANSILDNEQGEK